MSLPSPSSWQGQRPYQALLLGIPTPLALPLIWKQPEVWFLLYVGLSAGFSWLLLMLLEHHAQGQ